MNNLCLPVQYVAAAANCWPTRHVSQIFEQYINKWSTMITNHSRASAQFKGAPTVHAIHSSSQNFWPKCLDRFILQFGLAEIVLSLSLTIGLAHVPTDLTMHTSDLVTVHNHAFCRQTQTYTGISSPIIFRCALPICSSSLTINTNSFNDWK